MKNLIATTAILMATATAAIAQDEVGVPKEAFKEMAFLVGQWQTNGTFNGKQTSGTYSAEWAPGKHCLRLNARWTGAVGGQSSGIGGWSPDEKQYVEHWYASDGTSRTFRYSLGKEKGAWVGRFEQVDKDGKKGSGTIRLEKRTGEYRVSLNGASGGEKIVVESVAKKVK